MVLGLLLVRLRDVFLRLEAVFISGVGDGVNETVGACVLVLSLHFDGLVIFADLL